jgi:hypothetical protein
MVKVFILLGGLIGVDGYAVSPGILMLAGGRSSISPCSSNGDPHLVEEQIE